MSKDSEPTKEEWLEEAERYEKLKESISLQILENARFLRADLSSWYNALTSVCFTAGTIAITLSSDSSIRQSIMHPKLFWWGSVLLLVNGVYIFLLKKSEIEKDDRDFYKLRDTEADMWELRNVSREIANGKKDRVASFSKIKQTQTASYNLIVKKWGLREWVPHLIRASRIDIVFGLLLFPTLMIVSQIIAELGISYQAYKQAFLIVLVLYIIYTIISAYWSAASVNKSHIADKRIKDEVFRNS